MASRSDGADGTRARRIGCRDSSFFRARARQPGARPLPRRAGLLPAPGALARGGYSFFASLSSLAISRRVVSPFTVSMGLSFS